MTRIDGRVALVTGSSRGIGRAMTRGYALRLAGESVIVNAVAPGLVDTEMGRPLIAAGVAARSPMGRSGRPEEIASVVRLLVDDAYITGQTIAANGGAYFQ